MDLPSTLRDEVAALECELKADARVRKLIYLYALLQEYGGTGRDPIILPQMALHEIGVFPTTIQRNNQGRPRNAKAREKDIVEAVVSFLKTNGPAHRMDILETLSKKHLVVKDRFGMRLLAVYLTKCAQVHSIGNGVWALCESRATQAKAS